MGMMTAVLGKLKLRPLAELSEAEQGQILAIRNQPEVRKNMYTDHIISEAEHRAWVERTKDADHTRFFAVDYEGGLVGGVSLNAINQPNRRAEWAFYLGSETQGKGLGSALEFKFLDYAFDVSGLKKLNCEVLSFNAPVIKLHKKFGFVEEGVRRRHIERNGEIFDAHLLGITAEEWWARRARLMEGVFRG